LTHIVAERRELELARSNAERECARMEVRIEGLEQQVRDKEALVTQSRALAKAAEAEKASVDERLAALQQHCENLQQDLKNGRAELKRGNQDMQILKQHISDFKEKLTTKSDALRLQEVCVNDYRQKCVGLEEVVEQIKCSLQRAKDDMNRMQEENKTLKETVKEQVDKLKTSQDMVAFLHEEINHYHLGTRVSGNVENTFTYTSPDVLNEDLCNDPLPSGITSKLGGRSTNTNFVPFGDTPNTVTHKFTPGRTTRGGLGSGSGTGTRPSTGLLYPGTDNTFGTDNLIGTSGRSTTTTKAGRMLEASYGTASAGATSSAYFPSEPFDNYESTAQKQKMRSGMAKLGLDYFEINTLDLGELNDGELNLGKEDLLGIQSSMHRSQYAR
jgi:archaellum component FlaC